MSCVYVFTFFTLPLGIPSNIAILHPQNFDWKELLLGVCNNLDVLLWNKIKSLLFFHMWKDRNEALYARGNTNHKFSFVISIKTCAGQVLQKIVDAHPPRLK